MVIPNQYRLNKLLKQVNIPKTQTDPKGKIFVFPFNIILGTANSSEIGLTTQNLNPADFGAFEKIFSGRDSVLLQWEGATKLIKVNEGDDFFTKQFQIGVNRSGLITETLSNTEFNSSAEDTDFIGQRINKNIKIRFDTWNPADKDFFKFYIIPQNGSSNIFYISSATVYKDITDNSFIFSEVIFSNIKDEISSSGRSINNFVQFSAAGEGYAFPKVSIDKDQQVPVISIDKNRLLDRPVDEIQVEFYGNVIFNSIYCLGRKTANTFNSATNEYEASKKLYAPHFLFPYKATTPRTDELSRTSGIESNYYLMLNGEANITLYWKEWKESVAAVSDFSKLRNYEGTIITNVKQVEKTNNATTKRSLWDNSFTFNLTDFEFGNSEWNPYIEANISLTGDIKVADFNFFNAICNMEVEKLPLSLTQSTVFSIKDIPLIGGFLNTLSLGLTPTWANNDKVIAAKLINGLISCISYDFNSKGMDALEGKLIMDLFKNDTSDDIGGLIGTNSLTSGFRFKLTDIFDDEGIERNTVDLGQTKAGSWKVKSSTRTKDPKLEALEGYILDAINIKVVGKCDYKITAYSKGTPVYSGKFQTRGKFSGAIREYSNTIKLSNWNEENGKIIDYPELVIPNNPDTGENQPIDYNINLIANSNIGTKEATGDTFIETQREIKQMFNLDLDKIISNGYKTLKIEIKTEDNGGNSGILPIFKDLQDIKDNAPTWDGTTSGLQDGLKITHSESNTFLFDCLYKAINLPESNPDIIKNYSIVTGQKIDAFILKKSTGEYFIYFLGICFDIIFGATPNNYKLETDETVYEQNDLKVFKNKLNLLKISII